MTTIVYDHKKKTVSCDSRVCRDSVIMSDTHNKMQYGEDGAMYFGTGSVADFQEFLKASKNVGDKCPAATRTAVIKVHKGKVYECGFDEDDGYWEVLVTYSMAIGSGADFALAALDLGQSSCGAVVQAAKRDPCTGGDIHTYEVQ